MSEKKNGNGWLGAVVPRRIPDASATATEANEEAAKNKAGLMQLHPAYKMAEYFVDKMVSRMTDIVSAVEAGHNLNEKAYEAGNAVADATGTAVVTIEARPGYDYEIERLNTVCTGAGASVAVYLNEATDANLIETITAAQGPQRFSDGPPGTPFVPRRQRVIVVFSGCTVGSSAFVRFQIQRFLTKGAEVGR